jgi:hypothetical protein
MGLFKKKLDYSSGNGVLPKVDLQDYAPLRPPSSTVMRVPNPNLAMKEKEHGNLEKAFGAAVEAYHAPENDALTRTIIEKYLGALSKTMAPGLSDDGIQMLANFIGVGCGMAIVEAGSGLMVEGKCHPSITNVIFRLIQNLDAETKSIFSSVASRQDLLETAVEVGYVGTRLNGSLSPQDMLASIKGVG